MFQKAHGIFTAGLLCLAAAILHSSANAQTFQPPDPSTPPATKRYQLKKFPSDSPAEHKRRKGIDMVFLVDISKSMDDVFDDVQSSLIDYVQKTLAGDHIVIISFGEKARLEVKKSIDEPRDRKEIIRYIEHLFPSDYSTYIVAAVDKGLRELSQLKNEGQSKGNSRVRYLFLITDGKNNPPKDIDHPLTFDDILKSYMDFRPGQDWFMHYITLKRVDDNETKDFVRKMGGGIYNAERSSLIDCVNRTYVPVLTQFIDVLNHVEVKMAGEDLWVDARPETLLREGDAVRTGPGARAVINFRGFGSTGVDEKTKFQLERARLSPVSDSADISISLIEGRLTNVFEDVAGHSSGFKIITPSAVPYVGYLHSTMD